AFIGLGPLRDPTQGKPARHRETASTGLRCPQGSWVEPAGRFALLFTSKISHSNGCFQVVALANDRTHLRP
ncbi:hypothetical protein, partial [Pseudomonas aylmerensis]|uniref:hypothetical protein n=1 Tax=Pseudomonas aylmerensis TaxID=1869229 RepID=UPI001C470DFA